MSDTIEVIILAKDEVSGTVKGIQSNLSGLGRAFAPVKAFGMAAFLGVGAAAVGGLAMAGKAAIGMNASLEQSTMQFTTLMGDADLAAEHVAKLFEFGAKTPFETGPIIQASKHFQIFGGEALNTMENLQLVGDAAAAVGAPIDEVSFWVGRLYSNLMGGQPFGEAAMRLQELGIMTPAVRTELENMTAAGASGTEAFGAFQGALGGFTGAMEMQSQSWAGLTSTIRDQLGLLAADTLAPFFELLKTGLAGLSAWLASPEVQAGLANLAAGFSILITNLSAFVTEQVIPFVQAHGPALQNILVAIGIIIVASVLPALASMVVAMAPIILVVGLVAAAVALLRTAWEQNWGGIQEKVQAAWAVIQPALQEIWNWLSVVIPAALQTLRQIWDAVWATLVTIFNVAKENFQDTIAAIKAFFKGDFEEMEKLIKGIWERTWKATVEILGKLWDWLKPVLQAAWDNLKRWLQEDAKNQLRDKVIDILEGLAEWFGKLWDYLKPKFQETWNSIKNYWESIDWPALGRAVIKGAIDGIRSMGGALFGVLSEIVNNAIARIKAALGIASPSKVFYDIGVNIAEGLIEGIRSKNSDVTKALEEMLKAATDLAGIGSGFGGIFQGTKIAPLEKGIDSLGKKIGTYGDTIKEITKGLGLGDNLDAAGLRMNLQQFIDSPFASEEQRAAARVALSMLDERTQMLIDQAKLQAKLEEQQERLLRLEEQRAKLNFLQQQFELLKLIKDNNLGADILKGIKLGLDADPGQLMDAMVEAIKRMIEAAEKELGIASPSKWAARTAMNVMTSFADTIDRGGAMLQGRLAMVPEQISEPVFNGRFGYDAPGTTVVNIDARGAQRGVDEELRAMVEGVMREYGMRADIRMRTT